MSSKEFYLFCKQRSNVTKISQEIAMHILWEFLYSKDPEAQADPASLPTEKELEKFLDEQLQKTESPTLLEAWTWLKSVLNS